MDWVAPLKRVTSDPRRIDCVTFKVVLLVLERAATSKEYGILRRTICTRDRRTHSRKSSKGGGNVDGDTKSDNSRSGFGRERFNDELEINSRSSSGAAPCCACGEAKYEVLTVVCLTAIIISRHWSCCDGLTLSLIVAKFYESCSILNEYLGNTIRPIGFVNDITRIRQRFITDYRSSQLSLLLQCKWDRIPRKAALSVAWMLILRSGTISIFQHFPPQT